MSNQPLSREKMEEAVEAVRRLGSKAGAALELGIPRGTLSTRLFAAERAGLWSSGSITPPVIPLAGPAPPAVELSSDLPSTNAYEAEWRIFAKEIGMAKDRYVGPSRRPVKIGRKKILVVPDIHAPFHDRAKLAAMLEREKDADCAVVMGDIGDGYAISRFIKYESVPYEQELAAVEAVLERLSELFPEVVVIEGNHDAPRLEKQLRDRLSGDMVSAILSMTGGSLSPIEALCKRRFSNVTLACHDVGRHKVKWMTQIGDAIFCHAEKYSRVPGSALRSIEEWFADNEQQIELKPWKVVVQAHTHQLGMIPWRADKMLIECGCLATTPGYALGARMGGRPQRAGYVTLEQVDGVTDINSVRLIWLDVDSDFRKSA